MLRPTANLVHVDALQQCLCPRLALLTQTQAARSSVQHLSGLSRRGLHGSSKRAQNQAQPQRTLGGRGLTSDTSEPPSFSQTGRRMSPGLKFGSENPNQFRKIQSVRNDGTSYAMDTPTLSAINAVPYNSGRNRPLTSAQTIQAMEPAKPVEDDHGDAVNGKPPLTSKNNPAYTKAARRMLDLANHGTASDVFAWAKFMASKGYAPTLETYSYLIQACANPKYGANMQEIALGVLKELEDEGLKPDSIIYHNLLKIFAHSPDYLRMEGILKDMKDNWITVTTEGWQYIMQHWLATGQVERATDVFYERRSKGEKVHFNTYMEIIKALGRVNEVEEALKVMQEFQKEWGGIGTGGLPAIAWYELLDIAASNYHLEGVTYIWRKAVQGPAAGAVRPLLNPDDGLCLKVLNTAARHGSPQLALEVFRILSERKIPFREHHFAALIAAYAKALDFPSAFRALTLMRLQDLEPTTTTANSITDALVAGGLEDVDSAYFILKDFAEKDKSGEQVETAALNAILAACCKLGDLSRALGVYNECAILKAQPNTETFNILFAGCVDCSQPPHKELAMMLAGEMKTLELKPNVITYEELLRVSLYQEEDYEDAFMYLEEMKEVVEGGRVRPMVYEWIAQRLKEKGDPRLPMVLDEMKNLGYEDYVAAWEMQAQQPEPQPTV